MINKINEMLISLYVKAQGKAKDFCSNEDGDVNIVSIVVIIGIVILLAVLFKDQIANLLKSMFETISNNADGVISEAV